MSTQFLHIFLILLPLAAKVLSQNRCTTFDDIWRYLMIFDDIGWYLMMFCTLFSEPPSPCIKSSLPKQVMQCLQSDNVFAQRSQIKQIDFFRFDYPFIYWILEPSCCPERTVLGSDGSSVVYQLASGFLLFMIFIIIFGENHILSRSIAHRLSLPELALCSLQIDGFQQPCR